MSQAANVRSPKHTTARKFDAPEVLTNNPDYQSLSVSCFEIRLSGHDFAPSLIHVAGQAQPNNWQYYRSKRTLDEIYGRSRCYKVRGEQSEQ